MTVDDLFSSPEIPDYTLLRRIGRGAYGEVWLARNVMGTLRAVKVIWRQQFESARPFEREFSGIERYEPVSRSSGGLVHVLHVGRNERRGYFYYVMELADDANRELESPGQVSLAGLPAGVAETEGGSVVLGSETGLNYAPRTLSSELKRVGRLSTADCLRLAIEVAGGLAELHHHGLVHRDVKPGNIIYVSGRAKLADIGLVTTGGEGRTFVGTEGYIPPEGPGSSAADLYALGIVLYEASTGLSPEHFPDVPAEWVSEPGGDQQLELHEIVLKACEGRRELRYSSAEALQADLALLQSGQSVRHMRALERRYARLRLTGVLGTALLVCSLGATLFANYRARLAAENHAKDVALREQVQQSLARAEGAERDAQQQLYAALLEQARATVRSGELGQRIRALEAVRNAGVISNSAELRGAALTALALPDLRFERAVVKAPGTTLVEFDPSFQRVARCRGSEAVEVRSLADDHLIAQLPASTNVPAFIARWSPDGRYLAVKRDLIGSGRRADLEVWDVENARRVLLSRDLEFGVCAFHPTQPRLLMGLRDGAVCVWDLDAAAELLRYQFPRTPKLLGFAPDGKRFAIAYEQGEGSVLSIHQTAGGALIAECPLPDVAGSLDWHPDGRWIATADHGGSVRSVDAETGECRVLGHHKAQAVLTAFTGDGDYLLSAGWDQEFICWDARRLESAFTIPLNSFRFQLRVDGLECAVITDNEAKLYSFDRPALRRELGEALGPQMRYAAFSPDGRWLAASAVGRAGVWDLAVPGAPALVPKGNLRLFFSPEGQLFASSDEACFRWRVRPGLPGAASPRLEPLPLPTPEGFSSLCLLPNQVVLTGTRGTIAVTAEQPLAGDSPWAKTSDGVTGASADGRWIGIFRPFSRELHIYRKPGWEEVCTLTNRGSISGFDFSPNGQEVAVNSFKGVIIWSTLSWQPVKILPDFISLLHAPDNRYCWLARDFRNAGLYDARTLQPILPLPAGTRPLAISADGHYLAVSVDGARLQLWDLEEVRTRLRGLGLDW